MYDDLIKNLRNEANEAPALSSIGYFLMRQAADAIEELGVVVRTQKAVLDKFPRWIPVSERLPKEEETVLTWGKEYQCILLDWMHDNKWCCFGGADYWMPLPEPPEKESEP